MDDFDAKYALEDLIRRRDITMRLLRETQASLKQTMARLEQGERTSELQNKLRTRTIMGQMLVRVLENLAREARTLATELRKQKLGAPIDPSTIEVPDFLPEEL